MAISHIDLFHHPILFGNLLDIIKMIYFLTGDNNVID